MIDSSNADNDEIDRGDVEPPTDDFVRVPTNYKQAWRHDGHFYFYFFRKPGSDLVIIGITSDRADRINNYYGEQLVDDQYLYVVKWIKLTQAISPWMIEQFILFVADNKGYRHTLDGVQIIREKMLYSKEIVMDMVQVICSINKNTGYKVCFDGDTTKKLYWINSQAWNGRTGKSNMKDHPNRTNFRESLKWNKPETSALVLEIEV